MQSHSTEISSAAFRLPICSADEMNAGRVLRHPARPISRQNLRPWNDDAIRRQRQFGPQAADRRGTQRQHAIAKAGEL